MEKEPKKIFSFSAGPSVLPKEVLKRAQEELLDWHGSLFFFLYSLYFNRMWCFGFGDES